MKKCVAITCALIFFLGGVALNATAQFEMETEETPKPETFCPKTRISDNNKCMECHVTPTFELRETPPHNNLALPLYGLKIVDNKLYFKIEDIRAEDVSSILNYLSWHPDLDKHIILEIASFGGSLLEGWRIVGLIQEAQYNGIIVETRIYSHAMSAGFLVAIGGSFGHRYAAPHAMIMHHELWTIAWLKLETPSSKEDEAATMRKWQDNVQDWVMSRCTRNITKEFLDAEVRHKDMWMTGREMIELGFAEWNPGTMYDKQQEMGRVRPEK